MPDDTIPSFSAMLRDALGAALAPDATRFLDMFAEHGVMEFPFAPPGGVTRLDGRAALAAHLASLGRLIAIDRVTALVVHRTADPNVVILEFGGVGRGVETGEPYDQTYISVITLADGRIVHYRDYWNPLAAIRAAGGADAIKVALNGDRADAR